MMPDREKVINELNTDVLPFLQHHCDMQCDREKRWISKMIITVHDALVLLKEQEAVEPKVEKAILDYQSWHYVCGDCGGQIDINDNYCRHCGRVVAHLLNKI